MSISGPTVVCPFQTYTFTLNNAGPGESIFFLDVNGQSIPFSNHENFIGSNTTFNVPFPMAVGTAVLTVKTYFPNVDFGFVNETTTFNITLQLPVPYKPAGPDGYVILGCSANEEISISSLPRLVNGPSDCYFHCGVKWYAPNGWILDNTSNAVGNPIYGGFEDMKIKVPSGSPSGYIGQLTVTAEYADPTCGRPNNTSNSSIVWYGTPTVRDPLVNGQPSQSFNVVGSSAYLTIQSDAASSYTWTIVGGNGYIYPGTNSCQVSVSGFIRVEGRANNRCGSGSSYTFYLSNSQMYGFMAYPNPANDQLNVEFESKELVSNAVTGLSLFNEKGKEVKSFDIEKAKKGNYFLDNKKVNLSVSDLARGTYFLHISYGSQVYKSQVLLK